MEHRESQLNLLIAAGGTGGHLFPAQALALELLQNHPNIRVTFVGAGLKKNVYFKKEVFPFLDISSGTPFSKDPLKMLQALLKLSKGVKQCLRYFRKQKPDLIVGFGSFHTFPAIFAAKIRRVPILIFESNALPGRVNRFCSKWARVSAIQFSHASEYLKSKSICVQMPLLKKNATISKKEARRYFGLDENRFTLLIFGGSQGAQAINHHFCSALDLLRKKELEFQVIHIVGNPERAEKLTAVYQDKGISASVKAFEEKMENAWSAADLSISRAGAATLAELIEFIVPSILIPYPYGAENHQVKNALFVSDEIHGGVTIEEKDLTPDGLATMILEVLGNGEEKLKAMKSALRSFKEEENKEDLCSVVLKTI
ncbi:MAG: undecaprenyldiphospho-muramoylpentapeptide beta-N-acetylglucosaminyltransferase [Chlamydiales bacterium]|nr:undecaprenyldiphospho-muramoylpentapeptide beta-N-acetylglucosaminyltransferase [Chlamydiales bacterium]